MHSSFSTLVKATLLTTFVAGASWAEEVVVTIPTDGGPIVGTMNDADGAAADYTVLLLHGFTGTRDELPVVGTEMGVFSLSADLLAAKGIPSLRIDFRGTGDSTALEWPQTRFSTQIADAREAIAYLQEMNPEGKVVVLGWSQGGLVASHVASEAGVEGVVLWAPVARPEHTYSGILGADLVNGAYGEDAATPIEAVLPWGATTVLEAGFFHEFLSTDPVAAVASSETPLLVMVGADDTTVSPQPQMGEIFVRYHAGPSELVVLETDHVFGAFAGPELLGDMIDQVSEWMSAL